MTEEKKLFIALENDTLSGLEISLSKVFSQMQQNRFEVTDLKFLAAKLNTILEFINDVDSSGQPGSNWVEVD